jgi:N-acyl-D-aspartate/D-glutamate deacylase
MPEQVTKPLSIGSMPLQSRNRYSVRRFFSRPAKLTGQESANGGLIQPGFVADVAMFDPVTFTDRSTYAAKRTLAEGVDHVLVNGVFVLENGEPTGATPGRALRRG